MKFYHVFMILSALLVSACSFDLSKQKKKELPQEVILQGREFIKLPSEYPHTNQTVNIAPAVAKKVWELPLGTNPILHYNYQQGYVFISTTTNLLYLIDAVTGEIKWIINTPFPAIFPIGIAKKRIYYSAGDTIIEADKYTGKILHEQKHLQHVSIPINGLGYYNNNIYVTTTDGHIQSHTLTHEIGDNWLKKVPTWLVKPLHYLTGSLLIIPPYIYYSDEGGNITRISALSGGRLSLSFTRIGFKPVHPPIAKGKTLYQIFDDNTLYAINRHSMLADWTYPMGIPKNKKPLLGEVFLAVDLSKGVDVINYKGKKMYHSDLIDTPLCFDKEKLIGLSSSRQLIALDANGSVLWEQSLRNEGDFKQASNNCFFVLSRDKTNIALYATGPIKSVNDFKIFDQKINTPTEKQKKEEKVDE